MDDDLIMRRRTRMAELREELTDDLIGDGKEDKETLEVRRKWIIFRRIYLEGLWPDTPRSPQSLLC